MDNGHGTCVADEHVACTKQVMQELLVSQQLTAPAVKVYSAIMTAH